MTQLTFITRPSITVDEIPIPYDERPLLERWFCKPRPDDERVGTTHINGRRTISSFIVQGDLTPGQILSGKVVIEDVECTRLIVVNKVGDNQFECVSDVFNIIENDRSTED